jgi:hypothetical protein
MHSPPVHQTEARPQILNRIGVAMAIDTTADFLSAFLPESAFLILAIGT